MNISCPRHRREHVLLGIRHVRGPAERLSSDDGGVLVTAEKLSEAAGMDEEGLDAGVLHVHVVRVGLQVRHPDEHPYRAVDSAQRVGFRYRIDDVLIEIIQLGPHACRE